MMKKFNAIILSLVAVTASLSCTHNAFALDQGATQDFVGSSPIKSMSGTSDKAYTYQSDGVNRVNIYSTNGYNDSRIYNVNLQLENSISMSNGNIIMLNYMIKTTDEYAYRAGNNTVPICPSRRSTTKFNIIDCEIVAGNSESLNDNGSETNNHKINGVYYVMLTIRYASSSTDTVSTIYLGGDFLAPAYYNVTNTVYFSNVQVYTAWTYKNFIDSIGIYMTDLKNAISGIDLSQLEQYQRTMINQQSQTNNKLDNINDTIEQQRNEDKRDMNNAQSDASSSGSDSQSDAQNASSSLLSTLSTFIGALTDVSPSSCDLTLDTDYGGSSKFGFGTLNLCALSPPPAFQVISSVVVIGFSIPLVVIALREMLSLIWSFQK